MSLTNFIKIERKLSRYAAIEPSFQIRGPVLAQYVLAPRIVLANPRYSRIHCFATVHEFHGCFTKKE